MRKIDKVASQYRERGHKVRVLNGRTIEVTDGNAGNTYRVTSNGRAVVGSELKAILESEKEEPHLSVLAYGQQ